MRRALCVGIDAYPFDQLTGCVNDAQRMAELLAGHQDRTPNFDCRTLVAPSGAPHDVVTKVKLRRALEELFKGKADVALFHFSGHGSENNLGGYLVTQDATQYDEGVSMVDLLQLANQSEVDEVVVLLDCCHSGHLGQLRAVDNAKAVLREGVSILTASRADQISVETGGGGIFTSLVINALEGGASDLLGAVTAPAIYAFVETALGAWDQRPLFKSHLSKVIALRHCEPPISKATLRELPDLFPLPAEDFPLAPEYEESFPTHDKSKVDIFRKLQALNRVHLVLPSDAAHMFDAAMQSKGCRLTAAGRYYWRLARDRRIK